jgi:hypothetical protein
MATLLILVQSFMVRIHMGQQTFPFREGFFVAILMFTYLNPTRASDKEMEAIASFSNIIKKEEAPLDQEYILDHFKNLYRIPSPFNNYHL